MLARLSRTSGEGPDCWKASDGLRIAKKNEVNYVGGRAMRHVLLVTVLLLASANTSCGEERWPAVWKSYVAGFIDDQARVIDHDANDRTTSEAQAYAMFFALVANDRPRFDALLGWTERNLAAGDLSAHLPAWLWGRGDNQWGVLDANSASDADVWMAYTLLEAGTAWSEPRYTTLGTALAAQIGANETAVLPDFGPVLLPGANGFRHDDTYRLNVSYMPLQLLLRFAQLPGEGPWRQIADHVPEIVRRSSPAGFPTDWVDLAPGGGFKPSELSSFDAIRVYLWAGMLHAATAGREEILHAVSGMAGRLRGQPIPPAKVTAAGQVTDARGPVGFSAALLPYLTALADRDLVRAQEARLQSAIDTKSGLYGNPPRYYDQNLVLFGLGAVERVFWFDQNGGLHTRWHR